MTSGWAKEKAAGSCSEWYERERKRERVRVIELLLMVAVGC